MYSNLARSADKPVDVFASDSVSEDELKGLAQMIARRRLHKGNQRAHPSCVHRFVQTLMLDHPYDLFGMLLVDDQQHLIAFEELSHAEDDGIEKHSREVVKQALKHNAAGVILVHHLPNGDPEPSSNVLSGTQRLQDTLWLVDIRTVDHLMIGERCHVSFAERGWL